MVGASRAPDSRQLVGGCASSSRPQELRQPQRRMLVQRSTAGRATRSLFAEPSSEHLSCAARRPSLLLLGAVGAGRAALVLHCRASAALELRRGHPRCSRLGWAGGALLPWMLVVEGEETLAKSTAHACTPIVQVGATALERRSRVGEAGEHRPALLASAPITEEEGAAAELAPAGGVGACTGCYLRPGRLRGRSLQAAAVAAALQQAATMSVAEVVPELGRGVKRGTPSEDGAYPNSSHAAQASEAQEQLCELRYASARSALRKAQAEARRLVR